MGRQFNKRTGSITYVEPSASAGVRRKRYKSVRLILAFVTIGFLLSVTAISVWNYFDIALPASDPSSDLTDQSGFSNEGKEAFVPTGVVSWEFDAGDPVTVPPVIVGGTAYVVTGRSLQSATLSALDMASGDMIWTIPLDSVGDYPVSVAGNYLYIGTRGGKLLALDRHTSDEIWAFDTGESILGQPIVRNGVLYAASGRVYALDAATGDLRWSHELEGNASRPVAFSEGIIATVGSKGDLNLIGAEHGKRRLTFPLWFGPSSGPVISGETAAIAGNGGNVQALALHERDIPTEKALRYWWTKLWLWQMAPRPPLPTGFVWQRRGIADVSAYTLAAADGRIFIGTVDNASKGRVLALDRDTGETLWQFPSDSPLARTAALYGKTLLIGNEGGTLYGIDVLSGEQLWNVDVGSPIAAAPAVSDDQIFVPTLGGKVVAFE